MRVPQPETAHKPIVEGKPPRYAPAHMVRMRVMRSVHTCVVVGRLGKLLGKGCGRLSMTSVWTVNLADPPAPVFFFFVRHVTWTPTPPPPPHPPWQTHIASVTSAVVSFLGIHCADVSACHELLDVLAVAVRFVEDKVGLLRKVLLLVLLLRLVQWWWSGGGGGGWLWWGW